MLKPSLLVIQDYDISIRHLEAIQMLACVLRVKYIFVNDVSCPAGLLA